MGAAIWTPERAQVYDYSRFNMGPLNYALMRAESGRMQENRPDTWQGVTIGLMRGSKASQDLDAFLKARGVEWTPHFYNSLANAEDALRKGALDAVYTLCTLHNRDLVTLAILPTKLCYFCSNKRKPWIKKELDVAVEAMLQDDHNFLQRMNMQHMPPTRNTLALDAAEIAYAQTPGRKITVGFTSELAPLVETDLKTQETRGFYRTFFEGIGRRTGLEFEYLRPGAEADVTIALEPGFAERDDRMTESDWMPAPACWVRRSDRSDAGAGKVAIEARYDYDVTYIRQLGLEPLYCTDRDECYRAVSEGQAEALLDNMAVARYRLEVEQKYHNLSMQRIDSETHHRRVALITSTEADPRLRSILGKARDSMSAGEYDQILYDSIYRNAGASVKMRTVATLAGLVLLPMLGIVGLVHLRSRAKLKREHEIALAIEGERRKADAANAAKMTFLFNMSHDIRTPMNAIMGFTDIALKNLVDPERVRDCVLKTREAGGLLLTLINSVLDMSRIESGNARLEETEGDVQQSFVNIETTMQELAKAKDIRLTFEMGDIPDRYVYMDHDRCSRVFVNLISNAIKYTKNGGTVVVRCEQTGAKRNGRTTYRYTFKDNGIGMSEEFQKHAFEEFAREKNSTISGIQGTGLGLALCKSFVELMGGHIECESRQRVGTTFTVTLPLRVQDPTDYIDPETGLRVVNGKLSGSETLRTAFAGKKVLLVEDNELHREVATYALEENGFVVDIAGDGSIAVKMVQEKGIEHYDFILMDIQMPIMGGYEATKHIRELEREHASAERHPIPIIALSANAFAEDREASISAGMDDHVAKPIKVAALLNVLSRFASGGGRKLGRREA